MKKRDFIKASVLAGLGAAIPNTKSFGNEIKKEKIKNWVWINPGEEESENELNQKYKSFRAAGISGIFFEEDIEKHFIIAKNNGLETHRWIWTLNRGEKELLEAHPEWYTVSREGKSCADHPPYVNYYRWLCPSRPEVHDYLEQQARKVLEKDYVDGLHLDYVRYCDVILPVNLWDKYNIVQTVELPEYDFCYCDVCRSKFKELKGYDPMDIEYPSQSPSFRNFRYDNVSRLVNRLSEVAASYKKPITAAVFPTPEIARRIVRQDWTNWNLSGVCPMIYHGFYKEDVSWIGEAVREGMRWLCGKFPIYAGLFLPDFKSNEELKQGIENAMKNGASGISLFGNVNDEVLEVLKSVKS